MSCLSLPRFLLPVLIFTLILGGCTSGGRHPDIALLYNRTAQYHDETRNPVILIPGILGSRLVDDRPGEIVWGAFSGEYANPGDPDGARLVALPMREGASLDSLRDSVRSDGALETVKVKILGLPLTLSAYVDILATLGIGSYRSEELASSGAVDYGSNHFTCFQFDYDWRRDNIENAKLLNAFILKKRAYVQTEIEKRWGIADSTQDKVLQTLLPDVQSAAARRRIALEHLRKCLDRARRFNAALDLPATPPPDLHMPLIAGDAIDTPAVFTVNTTTGKLEALKNGPGDGTVLRSSALMDERVGGRWGPTLRSPIQWSQVHFIFSEHLAMTRDPAFTDNMLYLLLEDPH